MRAITPSNILVFCFVSGVISTTTFEWKLDDEGKIIETQLKAAGLTNLGCRDGKCFYSDETDVKNGTTFLGALEYCHQLKFFPARITSNQQNILVGSGLGWGSYTPFWLPLTDFGSEGKFRWIRTWEEAIYTAWAAGNPLVEDGTGRNLETNCVIHARMYRMGTAWLNYPCNHTTFRPLCEYP